MRMILGLDNPSAGTATVNGRRYRDLASPMREVGALLDPKALHPGRTAQAHLRWLARAGGTSPNRVEEVLDVVGLTDVAAKQVGSFSLGMYQRLGIATALLGDPATLLFDEPVNGLDPEGILWVRNLMRSFAAEGRTVFVSSHLMGEMQQTADRVVVIGRGRLVADVEVAELTESASGNQVRVLSPQPARLSELLSAEGASVESDADGGLIVGSMDASHVGEIAAANGVRLHELTPRRVSLESAFMKLTHDSVAYRSNGSAESSGATEATTTPNEDKGI